MYMDSLSLLEKMIKKVLENREKMNKGYQVPADKGLPDATVLDPPDHELVSSSWM